MMRACILLSLLVVGTALEIKGLAQKSEADVAETNYALAHGKPIFYQIVMGSFPFRKQYKLWLGALRQKGHYDGTVVIVTDKPQCIVNGLGEELLGGNATEYSDDNVEIYPGTGKGKVHILKVKTAKSVIGIKMHKSKAWNNIAKAKIDHPVSSIVYTDTDVVVAQDINSWLKYEQHLEKMGHTLAVFPDLGQVLDESQNLHTGVVVMFPTEASKRCIKQWGTQLGGGSDDPNPINHFKDGKEMTAKDKRQAAKDKKKEAESLLETSAKGVDQQALVRSIECHAEKGILKMPEHYISFPNQKVLKKGKDLTLFMHITNTGQWKMIGDSVKEKFFYDKLGLSKDIDFLAKGHCTREMWDTPEYQKLNAKQPEQQQQ